MNYHSDFDSRDSEFLFQRVESLRSHFSADALFLLEQLECDNGVRLLLKIKDQDRLFKIDATADLLQTAMDLAYSTAVKMALRKTEKKIQEVTVYH